MRKNWVMWSVTLISVLALCACSIQKDASEARKTTEKMSNTTDELKGFSNHLAKRTDDLENELTNKEAYAMMTANLDNLFGRNPVSREDEGLNSESDMILYAGAAVYSMIFQYWKGDYLEDLEMLDVRFKLAIEIMFARCLKHIPRDFRVDPFEYDPNTSYKAIAALGGKLKQMNPKYEEALQKAGLPHWTLYDVLIEGLRHRGEIEGETNGRVQLPKALAMVRKFKQEAQYLLQLRHNELPMMVVSRMSNFPDQGFWGRTRTYLFGRLLNLGAFADDSRSNGSYADEQQLIEWTGWLNEALETRAALREMGIEPEYNTTYLAIVRGMYFGQTQIMEWPVNELTPRQKLIRNFAEAYLKVSNPNN